MNIKDKLMEECRHGPVTRQIPNNGISEPGLIAVEAMLDEAPLAEPDVIDKIEYYWTVASVITHVGNEWCNKEGTFLKRIAKAMKRHRGISLSPSFMGKLGDTARKYCPKQTEVTWDCVTRFDWNDGDFGDSGSCFWGSHKEDRLGLERDKAVAFRVYREGEGYGRCWGLPVGGQWDKAVFFNAYSGQYDLSLLWFGRVISDILGLYYRGVAFTSNVYVNGDKGTLVGSQEDISRTASVHVHVNVQPELTCDMCGEPIDDEGGGYTVDGDQQWCDDCASNYASMCSDCEEMKSGDLTQVGGEDSDSYVCDSCIGNYTKCEECNEFYPNDDVKDVGCSHETHNVCKDCLDTLTECVGCSEARPDHSLNDDELCDDCRKELERNQSFQCAECGTVYDLNRYSPATVKDEHGMYMNVCSTCMLHTPHERRHTPVIPAEHPELVLEVANA
ncbi:MAG: hypothetical protein WC822_01395 [Candidatus Paceibacterota bacterium]|jgi:hypothetical protein